jgi:hypothetical protein
MGYLIMAIQTDGLHWRFAPALWLAGYLALVFFFAGCQSEQLDSLTKSVREATIDQIAPPKAAATGSIKLTVTSPMKTDTANVRLIVVGDGRPNVVQIRSYTDLNAEAYPSILIQATTTASDLNALAGQTLSATVYAAETKYLPIWSCMDRTTANLVISSVDKELLKATIQCGEVFSTDNRTSPPGCFSSQGFSSQLAARLRLRNQACRR